MSHFLELDVTLSGAEPPVWRRFQIRAEATFGDGWEHNVELRQSIDESETFQRRLLDGARAFPPEDSGGIFGYRECVVMARGSPDHGNGLKEWLGDWDPESFDPENLRPSFDR